MEQIEASGDWEDFKGAVIAPTALGLALLPFGDLESGMSEVPCLSVDQGGFTMLVILSPAHFTDEKMKELDEPFIKFMEKVQELSERP